MITSLSDQLSKNSRKEKPMLFRNVMFDLDGTLTDPYYGITNSIIHSMRYYPDKKVPSREELRPFIGPPLADSYIKYFGLDAQQARQAVDHYREYYAEKGIYENILYPGIKEMLEALRNSGIKIYMATSKPEVFAVRIAEHFGIKQYFDYICGSSMDGKFVEKKDIIAKIIEKEKCGKDTTLMIGDTVFDMTGAVENGIKAAGVTYGFGYEEQLRASGASYIFGSAEEISTALTAEC